MEAITTMESAILYIKEIVHFCHGTKEGDLFKEKTIKHLQEKDLKGLENLLEELDGEYRKLRIWRKSIRLNLESQESVQFNLESQVIVKMAISFLKDII